VVAWTAFVVIAGSAGLSTRRAWVRLAATILGAVGGVAIAAFVPDNVLWTVAVVAVGVFFTIVSAPVSYPAMVFWMSIAFVPLFATEGGYLDLIRDKTVAALIGGCVAAVVALTIVPIRTSREIRPAVLTYLDALDDALDSHLPGRGENTATTQAELDRAHAALAATAASAANETNVFAQPERVMNSKAVLVDDVHEAYLRLTPLLSDSSRILHGWTDERVEIGIHRLRDAVESARAAARGGTAPATEPRQEDERHATAEAGAVTLELADSLRCVEHLRPSSPSSPYFSVVARTRETQCAGCLHRGVGGLEHPGDVRVFFGADDVHHGVDQRQVGERLREVPQVPAGARFDLLGVKV
jgi:uncharacterized membrane protein YccC